MKRVGVISESKNDTSAIINLLSQRAKGQVQFKELLKNIVGHQLDNTNKSQRLLAAEWKSSNVSFVLYVRDLDASEGSRKAQTAKEKWFHALDQTTNGKGLFLLNVYELEALILADVATFNRLFAASINFKGDPMRTKDPKEYLQKKTKKLKRSYRESDAPEIFSALDITQLVKNCRYFKAFFAEWEKKTSP